MTSSFPSRFSSCCALSAPLGISMCGSFPVEGSLKGMPARLRTYDGVISSSTSDKKVRRHILLIDCHPHPQHIVP